RDLFAGSTSEAVLEITSFGQAGFDPSILAELNRISGVRAIEPRVRGAAGLVGPTGGVTVAVIGVELSLNSDEFPTQQEVRLRDVDDVLLDAGLADALGASTGQFLSLCGADGQTKVRLAGTLEPRLGRAGTGGLLVVSLSVARRLVGLPEGHVNCLVVRGQDGSDLDLIRPELSGRLPSGLSVGSSGFQMGLARSTLNTTEQALSALIVLALIAALFVCLNSFMLALNERKEALALLRVLGATRGQVVRLLLAESGLMGLAAAILASGVGTALAVLLRGILGTFLGLGLPRLQFRVWPYILVLALGPTLAALAAGWPAWKASREATLDELSPRRTAPSAFSCTGANQLGVVMVAVGLVIATRLCQGWFVAETAQVLLAVALALLL